jgi:hypothetical protein
MAFFEAMMALYPDRIIPGAFWGAATTLLD